MASPVLLEVLFKQQDWAAEDWGVDQARKFQGGLRLDLVHPMMVTDSTLWICGNFEHIYGPFIDDLHGFMKVC